MKMARVQLEEVCELRWGDTSVTKASYVDAGYPAFSASGCDGFLPYFDHEGPGIVLSAIGAQCGKTWFTRGKWSCIKNTIYIKSKSSDADTQYVFYALSDPDVWPKRGAAQPFISQTDARNVEIPLPSIHIQRRIASILSTYDELIENSQRRIKILESMSRALYREWFVHFRFPGQELISRVPSPIGDIPKGWQVRRMPECVDINPRIAVPRAGEKPFVPMGSLSDDSMLISDIESRQGNSGAKFQNGDTLFARITPCLENGKTGFVQFLPDMTAVAFGSTEFIVLRSRTVTPEFVYCLARSDELRGLAIKSMSGATGRQRVQERCFDEYQIAQPPRVLLDQFSAIVAPSFRLIQSLSLRIQNLGRSRNLLLPRLLSGRIELS